MRKSDHKGRAGESVWFVQNILRHSSSLRRYLLQLSRSPADVEDIEQEAYLRIYEAQKKTVIDTPRAFLFRTAYNLFVQGYRKSKNSPIDPVVDFNSMSVRDMCVSADEQLIARERLGALAEAIDRLPPQSRRVFIMRKVYNLSHKEISEALGISQSTIESHVGKGLQSCRDYIRQHDNLWMEEKDHNGDQALKTTVGDD